MSLMPMNQDQYGQPVMQDISRQRKLAEQLRQQEDLNGQMVSGHYVAPSWTQHLARALNPFLGEYVDKKATAKEKDYNTTKSAKIAELLKGMSPQTTQNGVTETSTMPAYEPSQMDRFGSPMQGVQREPVVTQTPNMQTETPEQAYARQREKAYQLAGEYQGDPTVALAISDMNHMRDRGEMLGDKTADRQYADTREEKLYNRGRIDKLSDTEAEHKWLTIQHQLERGEHVEDRDLQFAQQYKLQNSGFRHDESMQRQSFGHAEKLAAEKAKADAKLEKGTYDAERGMIIDTRTGEARPVTQNGVPFTAKLPEAQQKQIVGTKNLKNAIAEYKDQMGGWNASDIVKPDARAAMGVKYNNMMLQAKEAYNLGVLNGPDFEILTSVVTDPRSITGAITSNDALVKQATELDRIMGDISGTTSDKVRGNDTPYVPKQTTISTGKGTAQHPEDSQAVSWAKANPKDPRSSAILKANGL
jgi:hypothetical protein